MANEMEIVYVDPGYGKLVAYPKDSRIKGRLTWLKNSGYNTTSDVAFTHDGNADTFTYALAPENVLDQTLDWSEGEYVKKVWSLKCLVYFTANTPVLEIGFALDYDTSIQVGINLGLTNFQFVTYTNETKDYSASRYPKLTFNGLHDVSITYSWTADTRSSTPKFIRTSTVTISGIDTVTNTVETYSPPIAAYLPSRCVIYRSKLNPHSYVSNVLIGQASYVGDGTDAPSDDGIPVNTRIYRLTTSATDTNFTKDGDEYTTNTNGATLLQQITSTGDTPANHLVVYGNPGHGSMREATGISRENGIVEHGTRAISPDEDAHICDWWKDDNGNTFDDFYGKYVGWKAGG